MTRGIVTGIDQTSGHKPIKRETPDWPVCDWGAAMSKEEVHLVGVFIPVCPLHGHCSTSTSIETP